MGHEYERVMGLLQSANTDELEALALEVDGFPHGVDSLIQRRWIINAISSGSKLSVEWMIRKGVDLNFTDEEGFTPLHTALERELPEKHVILEVLLRAGTPVNRKGVNDWTPAHMAAAYDDVEALTLLVRYGADLSIRTDIDDYATPLEEAQTLGKANAAKYLASVV